MKIIFATPPCCKLAKVLALGVQKVNDTDRPDEAFTTERAVRAGRANAASGRIMVNIPPDHFGPIGPEHDPRGRVGHRCPPSLRASLL